MFVAAIETASRFTRPIHTILRYWDTTEVVPATATLFFVNDQGWALTCSHVAKIVLARGIKERYATFQTACAKSKHKGRSAINKIGKELGYDKGAVIELQNLLVNCIEGSLDVTGILHPSADLALIQFKGYEKLSCDHFPIFAANGSDLKPGKLLCRLGFPFPEFTNFRYNKDADQIEWTKEGRNHTPQFPLEGMVTRILSGGDKIIVFELSTPGLKGQSGGPAFDSDGRIWGVQFATNHLDLDFDVNMDVIRLGKKRHVQDYAFLRVGYAVHIDLIKDFMREYSVAFQEG
jgi:hypothetical protein